MIKRLFEYLALGILAVLGLAKLKGKRVNPVALRALLAILSFMALCLGSLTVLLFSGTWLLFLLAGDLAQKFGVNLSLVIPDPEEAGGACTLSESLIESEDSAAAGLEPAQKSFWERCKSFIPFIHG